MKLLRALFVGVLIGMLIAKYGLHYDLIPDGVQNWVCYHVVR